MDGDDPTDGVEVMDMAIFFGSVPGYHVTATHDGINARIAVDDAGTTSTETMERTL